MLTGILLIVAVMERCSVMESSGKREADEGDGVMNECNKSSLLSPVSPGRSYQTVVLFGKEFVGRILV